MMAMVLLYRVFICWCISSSTTTTNSKILTSATNSANNLHIFPSYQTTNNGTLFEKVAILNGLTRTVDDDLLEAKIAHLNDLVKETKTRIEHTRLEKQLFRTEAARKTEEEGKLLLEKIVLQKEEAITALSQEKSQLVLLKQQNEDEIASLLSRFNDLQKQSKEDKLSIGSMKREKDELETRMVALEEVAKVEKATSVSLMTQLTDMVASRQNAEEMVFDLQKRNGEIVDLHDACHTRLEECTNRPMISPPPPPGLSFLTVSEPLHSWWTVIASGLSMILLFALLHSRRYITSLNLQLLELTQIISTATINEQTLQAEIDVAKAETERLEAVLSRTIQHGASEYQSIMETKKVFEADAERLRANIRSLEEKIREDKEETELLRSSGIASELQMTSLRSRLHAAEADALSHKVTSEKTLTNLNASLSKVKAEHVQHLKECKLAAEKATKSIADAQARLKTRDGELSSMATTNTQLANAKAAADKEIEALKKQLLALQESSSQTAEMTAKDIANLEAANKQTKDQMAVLAKEYQSYKATSEKEFGAGTIIAQEYQSYKTTSEKTVSDLNVSLATVKAEYAQHLKECKLAAEKAAKGIADIQAELNKFVEADFEAINKQMKDQMAALAKEYQSYKTTSEQTVSALNTSLAKVKDKYALHLKECKLAAEKASQSINDLEQTKGHLEDQISTITHDLETANKQLKDQMTNLAREYQTYKTTSDETISDLNASLANVKNEHAQHLKECKLAAAQAAQCTDEFEETKEQMEDQISTLTQECQSLQIALDKEKKDIIAFKLEKDKVINTS